MPNEPARNSKIHRAARQEDSTLSIPRVTPQMVEQARQAAQGQTGQPVQDTATGQTRWDLDRAAAQRIAASNPRRRPRTRTPGAASPRTGTLPPLPQQPAADDAPASFTLPGGYRIQRPAAVQPPAVDDSTMSFTLPEAYRVPRPAAVQPPVADDSTMSFTLPEAYRVPRAPAAPPPAADGATGSFTLPEAYRPPQPQPPAAVPPQGQPAAPAQGQAPSTFAYARTQAPRAPRTRHTAVAPARSAAQTAASARPQPAPRPTPGTAGAGPGQTAPATPAAQAPAATKRRAAKRPGRAQAEAKLYQSIHDDHLWLNNPVMVRGLGLAPAVIAATSGNNALRLCAAAILLITATRVLTVTLCRLLGQRQRPLLYVISAAVLYIPAYCILYAFFGNSLNLMGIYLPILVADPVVVKRMEATELESVPQALRRGLNNTAGVCIALLLVGLLRELLATGALFGLTVIPYALLPLAAQPTGGFILVGVLAALWTAAGGRYVHYKQEEVQHLYAERDD